MTLLVLLVSVGAYLAYENSLPTTVSTNFKNGQKDVPTDSRIVLDFSRSVAVAAVQQAFSITPTTAGSISAVSGDTHYAWTPKKPLAELTAYTVAIKPIYDIGHHRVTPATWSFTTIIVPRITSVADPGGTALTDGAEIDPGATLTLTFNDQMEPITVKVLIGTQIASLKWAADDRSATLSTAGILAGPITLSMAPGGRDQSGHLVPSAFALNTGIYYHDAEHTTALKYPALIQIPNDQGAWDQNGLQGAGIVFEYLAEGGITRLTAVYDNAPDLIGPMRSSRFISLKLGRHYKGLLFQSGESQATRAQAAQDPTPQFFDTIGYQFRTNSRYAPDNLMIKGPLVLAAEQNYFSSIPAFTIPKARPAVSGGAAETTFNVAEHYSTYRYDRVTGTYQKSEQGHLFSDVGLRQPLRISMVVTLHTRETLLDIGDGHGAYIHDYDLDTNGAIDVYYLGQHYAGTWASTDSHGPLSFTVNGQPLSLPPGLVWIDVTQ
ncbi:MAG TPA: DUF3048 domain-containing protein [Candidatus Dormibacteraeota bacterium]|nr:DUF3048 domain-containing protein [Candidatus Dormibacteraeota bacterium]